MALFINGRISEKIITARPMKNSFERNSFEIISHRYCGPMDILDCAISHSFKGLIIRWGNHCGISRLKVQWTNGKQLAAIRLNIAEKLSTVSSMCLLIIESSPVLLKKPDVRSRTLAILQNKCGFLYCPRPCLHDYRCIPWKATHIIIEVVLLPLNFLHHFIHCLRRGNCHHICSKYL